MYTTHNSIPKEISMPRRPNALKDQFLDPPDLESVFAEYASMHNTEQTIAYLDGVTAVFNIVHEMLFAKMKDGSRWTETRERAFSQIDHFIDVKGDLLDRLNSEYDELRKSPNPSPEF
ncbi:hypothetical protein BEL04_18180 [Mucilaginibacter sp. PPCGB 2223]|uniref:hypothetical protein n=1 Tax=Mucilaginibacter sp. PPCGB 2223 TaxID=1886027 RepID=UPI0008261AB1|nr:hypothetical protein [Mucilaginibacter sp. PPCGB 2223]OCX51930.1 hypothetical protein BEL04_18180 [Mucilaginibacter sp. PPCGB 2223]